MYYVFKNIYTCIVFVLYLQNRAFPKGDVLIFGVPDK